MPAQSPQIGNTQLFLPILAISYKIFYKLFIDFLRIKCSCLAREAFKAKRWKLNAIIPKLAIFSSQAGVCLHLIKYSGPNDCKTDDTKVF